MMALRIKCQCIYTFFHINLFVKLLAMALTNLVLDLANLVTNLAKPRLWSPSHRADQTYLDLDRIMARTRHYS